MTGLTFFVKRIYAEELRNLANYVQQRVAVSASRA